MCCFNLQRTDLANLVNLICFVRWKETKCCERNFDVTRADEGPVWVTISSILVTYLSLFTSLLFC